MTNFVKTNHENVSRNTRKILVVGNGGFFSEDLINYSSHLAERLAYDLVALSVDAQCEGEVFEKRSWESARKLCGRADRLGIHCTRLSASGDIELAVEDTIHGIKRVEIVVVESENNSESTLKISVPVVNVLSVSNSKGGSSMEALSKSSKAVVIGKTIGYGAVSAALLAAAFVKADAVTQIFSRGGWYAALPIASVLIFSFVHGAFANNLWTALGIEALKRDQVRQTQHKVIQKRKQQRKRPRAYAAVNPFYRIGE
jgi:K+-sensing histidine kinase KdpD